MKLFSPKNRYFGFRGGWLTFWITVACGTDMTLFGYDQGVCLVLPRPLENSNANELYRYSAASL